MTLFSTILGLLLASQAGAEQSVPADQGHSNSQQPVNGPDNGFQIPAKIAHELRPYLDCVSSVHTERMSGLLKGAMAEVEGYDECSEVRSNVTVAAIQSLQEQNEDASESESKLFIDEQLDQVDGFFAEIARLNRQSFLEAVSTNDPDVRPSDVIARSYIVPDGMWEYHLCKSNAVSGPTYLNGEIAQPRFPDDPDCLLALDYSRQEALANLRELGDPTTESARVTLVQGYVQEIDDRTQRTEGRQ